MTDSSGRVYTELDELRRRLVLEMPDNPACQGWKSYSQCDEDGIIRECLRRIAIRGPMTRTFIEVGCGDGLENNTHQLLLDGFRGCWLDGGEENVKRIGVGLGGLSHRSLSVRHEFIDLDNIATVLSAFVEFLQTREVDLFSFDIDGNDLLLTVRALDVLSPKLLCLEYNAKFPPPTRLSMSYARHHRWDGTDYFGASLSAWVEALPGYTLVSCNLSGANAFFVRNDFSDLFTTYDPGALFQPPRYWLTSVPLGHQPCLRWLRQVVA